jgi:uncharacterized protein YpbB
VKRVVTIFAGKRGGVACFLVVLFEQMKYYNEAMNVKYRGL